MSNSKQLRAPAGFEPHRAKLLRLAHHLLGTQSEAEDAVQETYLRWYAQKTTVTHSRRWLTTVCTRLCIDERRSARFQRETYVGAWLPEPIVDATVNPDWQLETQQALSYAVRLCLQRLSAPERAAYLLHHWLGYSFLEIADVLQRTETACKKLSSRARQALSRTGSLEMYDPAPASALIQQFLHALREPSVTTLEKLLLSDAVSESDSGGKVSAATKAVQGSLRVARLLAGVVRKYQRFANRHGCQMSVSLVEREGLSIVALQMGTDVQSALLLSARDGALARVDFLRNPDKLKSLLLG